MSADWKAGDKALCVEPFSGVTCGDKIPYPDARPVVGVVYLVESVTSGIEVGLILSGFKIETLTNGYVARKFRKLVPACDRNEREQTELRPMEGFWREDD